jgi:hypothetical protein
MAILNYTTKVSVEKSMGEVIAALSRRGVTRISTTFNEDGEPTGVAFTMKTDYGLRDFELPVRPVGVLAALIRDKVPATYRNKEQAARVAWRIAKDWLEAQSALIDANLAKLDEVMTPYMIVDADGHTVYEMLRTAGLKELEK